MAENSEEDCKVCKKLFTNKKPHIMADNFHGVIKCTASDVDSSDSCSEKGQGHSEDATLHNKPVSKKKLNIKPESVLKLLTFDGDSSENCSEKEQRSNSDKVKETSAALNSLATKPPKVKSVRSLVDAKKCSDSEKPDGKALLREQYLRGGKKAPLKSTGTSNQDKVSLNENVSKHASSSYLQNIIDEAMDHFQKLSAKSANAKALRKAREENKGDNMTSDPTNLAVLAESEVMERITSPDRPSSREETISPNHRHLILPGTENRSSPSHSCSGSRRKLPQPPSQNKLRCSVTSFVHSSMESDSSRPNSSADLSDRSDSSNVSRTDSIGSVSSSRSGREKNIVTYVLKDEADKNESKVANKQTNEGEGPKENCKQNENMLTENVSTKTQVNAEAKEHQDVINLDLKKSKEDAKSYNNGNNLEMVDIGIKSQELSGELNDACDKSLHSTELDELAIHCNEPTSSISNLETSVTTKDDNTMNLEESDSSTSALKVISNVPIPSPASHDIIVRTTDTDSDNNTSFENNKETAGIKTRSHISRSPSYRKKVMAKARSRYHRQLKSLKCKTGECKGNCSICTSHSFEEVPRSHTSLGVPGIDLSEEEFLDQSSPRRAYTPELPSLPIGKNLGGQRSLKKVPISSRVDILMSNNLFKKHLSKHEDLLQRHTLSYRKFGMQKAVSNLDLSEGFLLDESGDNDVFEESENMGETLLNASLNLASPKPSHTSRRHSLTGENNINLSELIEREQNRSDNKVSKSGVTMASHEQYQKGSNSRQSHIPTFAEFRQNRSHKRRILPSNTAIKEINSNASHVSHNNNSTVSSALAEVTEITYSRSELLTVDESSTEEGTRKDIDSEQNSENLISSSQNSVIEEGKSVISEEDKSKSSEKVVNIEVNERTKADERTKVDESSTVQESRLEPVESADNISVNKSLNVDDKSPLSTSEMDYLDIPHRQCNSETDSVGSQDLSYSDLSSSDVGNKSVNNSALKERHRKGSKRPRSLISKKASLLSLIHGSEKKDGVTTATANRPTIRRGHSLSNLTKTEIKHTVDESKENQQRVDSFRSVKSEGGHPRKRYGDSDETNSLHNKGDDDDGISERHPAVNFTVEIDATSEDSQDARESELASQAGSSVSESMNSEVSLTPCHA